MRSHILVVGLLLAFSWLPWLVSGRTAVTHLPGFAGSLPFELETGYVKVDETRDVNLFYYFVKSERNPVDDPLILWLCGSSCSGLSSFIYEVGPLGFDIETYEQGNLPNMFYRDSAWTKNSSIIFIDSPVGSGFSYSSMPDENERLDSKTSTRLHAFIRKWLQDHEEFISNPFYVSGVSYGGKLAVLFADEVINGNEAGQMPIVNLKGYLVGNAATGEDRFDRSFKIPWSHGVGLISNNLYEATRSSCGGDYLTLRNAQCEKYIRAVEEHILEPQCDLNLLRTEHKKHRSLTELQISQLHRPRTPDIRCRAYDYLVVEAWANSDEVQKVLGVSEKWTGNWVRCLGHSKIHTADVPSVVSYHQSITQRGFRALVYSGDHDMLANFLGTQAWLSSLNYSIIEGWRPWHVSGQVAGYTNTFANNLTYATVKGAGHTATEYKPDECKAMFERWITGKTL
ncbi:serine carboxypeptidase-like 2 isoform X2 [Wolffia australiana]